MFNMRCYMEFLKCIRKKTHTLEALITILALQSSPLGSVHNDPNISAMIGSCPGSPFVSAPSASSAVWSGSPLQCQIFAPSTQFSSWGGGRSHRGTKSGKGWEQLSSFERTNLLHTKAVCTGALSWWSTQLFMCHLSGRFHLMSSLCYLREVTVDLHNDGLTCRY